MTRLFIQSLVMLEQRLKGLEDLHLTGDPRWRLGLSFHHCHPQTALVAGHQTLQVLQQQLEEREKLENQEDKRQERETKCGTGNLLVVKQKKKNQNMNV